MSEESLNQLTLDQLFDLMIKHVNDIISLPLTYRNIVTMDERNDQLELIQKVIKAKLDESQPVK